MLCFARKPACVYERNASPCFFCLIFENFFSPKNIFTFVFFFWLLSSIYYYSFGNILSVPFCTAFSYEQRDKCVLCMMDYVRTWDWWKWVCSCCWVEFWWTFAFSRRSRSRSRSPYYRYWSNRWKIWCLLHYSYSFCPTEAWNVKRLSDWLM